MLWRDFAEQMRHRLLLITVLMVAAVSSMIGVAEAHQMKHKALTIEHPWVEPMADPSVGATVHMKIMNSGADDRLVSATTPRADRVVFQLTNAEAAPQNVDFIDLPSQSTLQLGSQTFRLRLEGLKAPLEAYDSFDLALHFVKAGKVVVEVLVDE